MLVEISYPTNSQLGFQQKNYCIANFLSSVEKLVKKRALNNKKMSDTRNHGKSSDSASFSSLIFKIFKGFQIRISPKFRRRGD